MDGMVERIARLLNERDGGGPWEGGLMGERGRDMWRETARAVIEAMLEPTNDMIDAVDLPGLQGDPEGIILRNWRAMLNTALDSSRLYEAVDGSAAAQEYD